MQLRQGHRRGIILHAKPFCTWVCRVKWTNVSDAVEKSWNLKADLALICVFAAIGALLVGAFHVLQYRWDSLTPTFDIKKHFEEEHEELPLGERKLSSIEKGQQFFRLIVSDESDVTITVTADGEDDDLYATLGRYGADFKWFRPRHLNDDSGGSGNPKIETRLPRGKYLLSVESFAAIEQPIHFSVRTDAAVVVDISRGGPAGGEAR